MVHLKGEWDRAWTDGYNLQGWPIAPSRTLSQHGGGSVFVGNAFAAGFVSNMSRFCWRPRQDVVSRAASILRLCISQDFGEPSRTGAGGL